MGEKTKYNLDLKIVFVDIDNTLVPSGRDINLISEKDIESLKNLQKENIYVVISTGRGKAESSILREKIRENEYGDYLVVSNGSEIYGPNNELISKNIFPNEKLKELIKFGIENKYVIKIANLGILFSDSSILKAFSKFYDRFEFKEYSGLENIEFKEENYSKIGFFFLNKKSAKKATVKIKQNIKEVEVVLTGKGHYIEINNDSVSKGYAANIITEKLKIDIKQTIAFGDSLNDYSLFKEVKYGIAMENSMPELIKIASFVTLSAKNSGVSHFIENEIKNLKF